MASDRETGSEACGAVCEVLAIGPPPIGEKLRFVDGGVAVLEE